MLQAPLDMQLETLSSQSKHVQTPWCDFRGSCEESAVLLAHHTVLEFQAFHLSSPRSRPVCYGLMNSQGSQASQGSQGSQGSGLWMEPWSKTVAGQAS